MLYYYEINSNGYCKNDNQFKMVSSFTPNYIFLTFYLIYYV